MQMKDVVNGETHYPCLKVYTTKRLIDVGLNKGVHSSEAEKRENAHYTQESEYNHRIVHPCHPPLLHCICQCSFM